MSVQEIHAESELDILKSTHKYVLIDFTATWCPPCRAIAPFYANLAKKHTIDSALAFAKVDVDEVPDVARQYGITAMPSFLVLVDGEPAGVDVAETGISGGGAVVVEDKVGLIRGADPKNLTALAAKLEELAKTDA
ncbi:hypothetical protein OQA88_5322 [Cercophora sp. LCS_1]